MSVSSPGAAVAGASYSGFGCGTCIQRPGAYGGWTQDAWNLTKSFFTTEEGAPDPSKIMQTAEDIGTAVKPKPQTTTVSSGSTGPTWDPTQQIRETVEAQQDMSSRQIGVPLRSGGTAAAPTPSRGGMTTGKVVIGLAVAGGLLFAAKQAKLF